MALRNISNSMSQPLFNEQPVSTGGRNMLKNKLSLSISSSTSSSSSDNETNSAQIRTSSPISSSSSSQADLFAPAPFNPVFKKKKHDLPKIKSYDQPQPHRMLSSKHVSIRELAYEKLKKQQKQEQQKLQQQQQQHHNPQSAQVNNIRSNGKLKIAAYNNVGHLTVHIIKGRSYRTSSLKTNETTDTYVKLTMLPDGENRFQQCQTMIVKHKPTSSQHNKHSAETINYDEKFSFELSGQHIDLSQRLVISVWSRHTSVASQIPHINSLSSSASSISTSSSTSINNQSHMIINDQLIGCFSFKIKNLMNEPIQPQWYHLLPEQQGLNKHFRCHRPHNQPSHPTKSDNYEDIKQITNLNKDLIGMERFKFRVTRPNEMESYGFTITNNCPCMIGKVDSNKQAYMAGLRAGDYLSMINNKNVSRATCESVVKLIKTSRSNCLELEVCREKKVINTVITQRQSVSNPVLPQHSTLINPQSIPHYNFRQIVQQPPVHQQPIINMPNQRNFAINSMSGNNQLEVVIEEDENVISDEDSFDDHDQMDEEFEIQQIKQHQQQQQLDNFCLNQLDNLRHVDSSDLNTTEDDNCEEVEEMRRAAAKYYSNEHFNSQPQHQLIRQANIMSLKNLKIF